LDKGFYFGDYLDASFGFGPYQTKKVDERKVDMMLLGSFGLGFQTGYKISGLPELASIEARWYINGTFNNIRSNKVSQLNTNYDDFLNYGFTGRYGSFVSKVDVGYKYYKSKLSAHKINAKRFGFSLYWMFDKTKKYRPGSFNSAIGLSYEGFYNYYLNNRLLTQSGRNHNISINLTIIKF
jgi:hypothetical protein